MFEYIRSFGNARDMFLSAVAVISAIMFAIIIHECAHGYVAKLNGDPTAELSGRLTFNPAKHFDIIGILMFLVAGFGWAKPVPVDYRNFRKLKQGIFTVAIAGVVANFIAVIAFGGIFALLALITKNVDFSEGNLAYMLMFLISQFLVVGIFINIALIAFNILPIFPLDGFRIVEAFTKPNNAYVMTMRRYGIFFLIGFIFLSQLLGNISPYLDLFGLYLSFMRNSLYNLLHLIFPTIVF